MLGISNGKYIGFARCYVLASEIIAFTDCKIDKETINTCLRAYQKKKLPLPLRPRDSRYKCLPCGSCPAHENAHAHRKNREK